MKPKCLMSLAAVVAVSILVVVDNSGAQPDAAPVPQPAPPVRATPPNRPFPPGFRGRPSSQYFRTIAFLNMSKAELQRSTNDFNGHRQTAIDACDKAMKELQAVQDIVQAEAAAKAAAARAAATNNPAPTPAPPAAPNQ